MDLCIVMLEILFPSINEMGVLRVATIMKFSKRAPLAK